MSQNNTPGICENHTLDEVFLPPEWEGNSTYIGQKCSATPGGYYSDIAVLVLHNSLSSAMFKNGRAAIATLPDKNAKLPNTLVIAGYGLSQSIKIYLYFFIYKSYTLDINLLYGTLHAACVNTYTRDQCRQLWKTYYNFTVTHNGESKYMGNKAFSRDLICINYTVKPCFVIAKP